MSYKGGFVNRLCTILWHVTATEFRFHCIAYPKYGGKPTLRRSRPAASNKERRPDRMNGVVSARLRESAAAALNCQGRSAGETTQAPLRVRRHPFSQILLRAPPFWCFSADTTRDRFGSEVHGILSIREAVSGSSGHVVTL